MFLKRLTLEISIVFPLISESISKPLILTKLELFVVKCAKYLTYKWSESFQLKNDLQTISVSNLTSNIEPAALFENFKSPYSRRRRKDRDSISRLLLLRRLKSLFHHPSFFGKSSREGPFRKSDTGSFPEHYLEPINSSIKNRL